MKSILTRFRAYRLCSPGSSFSHFADGRFTIIEARLTEESRASLIREMALCNVVAANTLHISSWDEDHCAPDELEELLKLSRPELIECPGYTPHSECGRNSREIIAEYRSARRSNREIRIRYITPDYINGLNFAEELALKDTLFNPRDISEACANDNSTVKHFRRGSFNVLSLGDVQSAEISQRLRRSAELRRETDLMILAHHGADNGFTNKSFLERVRPQLAICSSDYGNRYDHPRQEVKDLLHEQRIRLMTTKTGDVIVKSTGDHTGAFRALNLIGGSSEVSCQVDFRSKKARLLAMNTDSLRNLYRGRPAYRKL